MIYKLQRGTIKWVVVAVLVEEKVYRMLVQSQRKRLQKTDVISQNFFVIELEFMVDDLVYVVVGE
jgi:hypothetical protein